jgi:predicted NBD/HSP70 family sugar kinase
MMCGGIDLHSNNSVAAVIDEADRIVARQRLPNDLTKVVGFLNRWKMSWLV